jgi:hypothetical protein
MAASARPGTRRRRQPWTPEPGARVRLRGRGPSYTLAADTGTVEQPDPENPGYYFVRLDEPATYYCADGTTEPLPVIREADDNLLPLADHPA